MINNFKVIKSKLFYFLCLIIRKFPFAVKIGFITEYNWNFDDYLFDNSHNDKISKVYIPRNRIDAVQLPAPSFINNKITINSEYEKNEYRLNILWNGQFCFNPFGYITSTNRLLFEESSCYGNTPKSHWFFRKLLPTSVKKIGGRAFMMRGSNNYWHFVTEDLSKIKILEELGQKISDYDHILMSLSRLDFQKEYYELLGYENIYENALSLETSHRLKFDELHFFYPRYQPDFRMYSWVEQIVKKSKKYSALPNTFKKRLFISRSNSRRTFVNEDEIWSYLKSRGFHKVECHRFSIFEQAKLFADAEVIIGIHGAGLTNLLFSSSSASVIEIRNKDHYGSYTASDCYYWLSAYSKLSYNLLLTDCCSNSSFNGRKVVDSNLYLSITELEKTLDMILHNSKFKKQ